jgi:hypothetical protein
MELTWIQDHCTLTAIQEMGKVGRDPLNDQPARFRSPGRPRHD